MKSLRRSLVALWFIIGDAVMIYLAFRTAYWVRFDCQPFLKVFPALKGIPEWTLYQEGLRAVIPIWILLFALWGRQYSSRFHDAAEEFMAVSKGVILGTLLIVAATFLYREYEYSRLVMALGFFTSILFLFVSREIWKAAIGFLHGRLIPQETVIVIGGGKTAMDTAVWLLEAGIEPDAIDWVRPRDSWMFNRKLLQPAWHRIEGLVRFQMDLAECAASSETGDEMFAKLGERGSMLRIDPDVTPSMFHFAVLSEAEVAMLRTITRVHRGRRVTAIAPGELQLGEDRVELPDNTLFIDCTATAVPFEARANARPFFDGDTITLQLVQTPFVPYSAALAAFVEANFESDEEKNNLLPTTPLTDTTATYPYAVMANLMSAAILSNNEKTNAFNAKSRLHPTGPAIARMIAENDPRLASLGKVAPTIQKLMPGVIKLGMAAKAIHEGS